MAGQRQALADGAAHPFEQQAKPFAKPPVGEHALGKLRVQLRLRNRHRHLAC